MTVNDTITASSVITAALKLPAVPVANLPGSPIIGQLGCVSDGTAALAWGATVTGGGSTKYLVWWQGSAWTIAGK